MPEDLTPRELDIVQLFASGFSNNDIATECCIAVKTVENHIGHILAKLHANDRAHALAIAFSYGLVTPIDLVRAIERPRPLEQAATTFSRS